MLPVYKALSFQKVLDGGSTRPWLVLVTVDGKPEPYVVKLFKKKHVDEAYAVAKEVYCSILANQFGLTTPKPALIEFSSSFIAALPIELKNELSLKDNRIKFGSKLIEGTFQYVDTLQRESFKKYDIQTIYAFDNLIWNTDRRPDKPNILFKGNDAYLIDHEISLLVDYKTVENFNRNSWVYWSSRHIFYSILKNGNINDKRQYFGNFQGLLGNLNIDILDSYSKQLIEYRHHNEEHYSEIKNYLYALKQNPAKLVQLLIGNLG